MTSKRLTIECKHGTQTAAVVCKHHLVAQDEVLGFVEISSDPDDLQAWCDQCETFFQREGALTKEFKLFNNFTVICVVCYSELKTKHSR